MTKFIKAITPFVRAAGFILVCVGLLFRILHWPYGNECLIVGGALVVVGLILNLIGGGWEMSSADEKVRLMGHLCILYGFTDFLSWMPELPYGMEAIWSGLLLLGLGMVIRRRNKDTEPDPADKIDEIGKATEEGES